MAQKNAVVISYRRFGTTYQSHLQGLTIQELRNGPEECSCNFLPTFRTTYQSHLQGLRIQELRNGPEECSCNFLPTFRDNLSVPSSRVKNPRIAEWPRRMQFSSTPRRKPENVAVLICLAVGRVQTVRRLATGRKIRG